MSYLLMMSIRLMEMKRVLKESGSIYLHCDPTESHSLKLMMDTIWGRDAFRREIIWQAGSVSGFKSRAANWIRDHDVVLYYGGEGRTFRKEFLPYSEEYVKKMFRGVDEDGRRFRERPNRRYYEDEGGVPVGSVWTDILSFQTRSQAAERVAYPTQKPLALLERIISASSNENDMVLDPFCGCATAAIASEKLGRQWVGIDISERAIELVQDRLHDELGLSSTLAVHRTDTPLRTDLGKLPKPATHKKHLYGEQEGVCNGCETYFPFDNLSIDHIVSRKHGGTDHVDNLQLLCHSCNSRKGAGTMSEFMAKLLERRNR